MNNTPQFTKKCHRCPIVVRMTREKYEAERDQAETTCDRCRAILTAEAEEILKNLQPQFPKAEAQQPQAPAVPANPT